MKKSGIPQDNPWKACLDEFTIWTSWHLPFYMNGSSSALRQGTTRLAMKAKLRNEMSVTWRKTDISWLAAAGNAAATTTTAIWDLEKPPKALELDEILDVPPLKRYWNFNCWNKSAIESEVLVIRNSKITVWEGSWLACICSLPYQTVRYQKNNGHPCSALRIEYWGNFWGTTIPRMKLWRNMVSHYEPFLNFRNHQ